MKARPLLLFATLFLAIAAGAQSQVNGSGTAVTGAAEIPGVHSDGLNGLQAGNVVAPLQPRNARTLKNLVTKLAKGKTAAPVQIGIATPGDSVAQFKPQYFIDQLGRSFGFAGAAMGTTPVAGATFGQAGFMPACTGTVYWHSGGSGSYTGCTYAPLDYTRWFTGQNVYEISNGGCVVWSAQNPQLANIVGSGAVQNQYINSNKLMVFYIAEPGAGSLTISDDTWATSGTFVTETTVNAANATQIGAVWSMDKGGVDQRRLQTCATGGTVWVLGVAELNTLSNGVYEINLAQAGAGLDQMERVPSAIYQPILAALAPDVVTFEAKEQMTYTDGSTFQQRLQTLRGIVAAANPQADFIWIASTPNGICNGTTCTEADQSAQIAQNEALRAFAASNNDVWWDGFGQGTFLDELARGWFSVTDGTHLQSLGAVAQSSMFIHDLGLTNYFTAQVPGYNSRVVAKWDMPGQTANFPNGYTIYTIPAGQGGHYRITASCNITRAATTSSNVPQVNVKYTEAESGALQTKGVNGQVTSNSLGDSSQGRYELIGKAGTPIQIFVGGSYASSGATAMMYSVHITLEYLGPIYQ